MDFKKEALLERLVRLGATDVPGTPRAVMKHRSPEELADLQHSITGAFQKWEEPAKKAVHGMIDKIPHAGTQRVLKGGANMMIENPEMIPMQALPVPGISLGYLGAKKGLEKGLDRIAPIHKTAGAWLNHAALNAGQAKYFATATNKEHRSVKEVAKNIGYAILPPHVHHNKEDLAHLREAGPKEWWRAGADPYSPMPDRPKVAFSTNAFSGPMNPTIATGASDLPPFKAPGLRAPVQKTANVQIVAGTALAGLLGGMAGRQKAEKHTKGHGVAGAAVGALGASVGFIMGAQPMAELADYMPSTRFLVVPVGVLGAANAYRQITSGWDKEERPRGKKKVAFKLEGHDEHQGLRIAIENKPGSVRKGTTEDGKKWRTVMKNAYGYLKGTHGADGDEVDCYLGPHKDATHAHVVHQRKPNGKDYDEDKVMLGFKSKEDAKKAYLDHYDDPKFLGPMKSVPMARLKQLLESGKKLVKIADAEADKPGEKKPGLIAPAALAAFGGLNMANAPDAATKMLGYQPVHHGTSNEAAAKIREVGLDPAMGAGPHGASAATGDVDYLANSKGHVHIAPSKSMAGSYATIAEASGAARKAGRPYGADDAVADALRDSLKGEQRGSILSGAMPYDDFKKNFHPDPDTGEGFRSTKKVAPEVFKTDLKSIVQKAVKDPKSVGSFIKKHPGQFARGAAGLALPAAAVVGGGMWLHHNLKKRKEMNQPKLAASSPTRGGFMLASDIPAFKSPSLSAPVEKTSDMLPDYISTNDGVGFKRSKYARLITRAELLKRVPETEEEAKQILKKDRGEIAADNGVPYAKIADVSPTSPLGNGGGNPHRAQSDLPPFRGPNLRAPLTKVSEFSDVSAYNGGPSSAGRGPVNEAGFRQAGDQPGIPVNSLRAPLIKRGSFGISANPMGAMHASKMVGVKPMLKGAPGPDIAKLTKPPGKGFGGPMPGATKAGVGAMSVGGGA